MTRQRPGQNTAAAAGGKNRASTSTANASSDCCRNGPRDCGANAGEQLQCPESGDAVARVLRPAQDRQHVLDMGGLEKFEAAIFDEGNITSTEFDLEEVAMMRAVRNSTACRRSAMPASRWSSTLSATYRACAASSSTAGQERPLRRSLGRIQRFRESARRLARSPRSRRQGWAGSIDNSARAQ